MPIAAPRTDERFTVPLYSLTEAARHLDVPRSTFATWAKGYVRRPKGYAEVSGDPIVTTVATHRPGAVVPFVGLVEGLVLSAFRRTGLPLQRIRPAVRKLQDELGLEHALASRSLYTDGAEVLRDLAEHEEDTDGAKAARQLVVVRNDQRVFGEIVESYLRRIEFGDDGWPTLVHLPQYTRAEVVIDPRRSFGLPIFTHGGCRVEDVISSFKAGEDPTVLGEEYGVPPEEILEALRVLTSSP